jgi:hypothetical protein
MSKHDSHDVPVFLSRAAALIGSLAQQPDRPTGRHAPSGLSGSANVWAIGRPSPYIRVRLVRKRRVRSLEAQLHAPAVVVQNGRRRAASPLSIEDGARQHQQFDPVFGEGDLGRCIALSLRRAGTYPSAESWFARPSGLSD